MIKIEHLKKEYPDTTPLKDVSVTIHDGDVIAVIGPSGTGKSTLLRCINLLEKPRQERSGWGRTKSPTAAVTSIVSGSVWAWFSSPLTSSDT